jgi:hypothetical protein
MVAKKGWVAKRGMGGWLSRRMGRWLNRAMGGWISWGG